MPQWQSELEALLAELHVSLDGDASREHPDPAGSRDLAPERPERIERIQKDGSDPSIPWDLGVLAAEEPPAEDEEVGAVRSEIEATVRRVIEMARTGKLDGALRDDVVFVLQALTRPHPLDRRPRRGREDAASQEWQLASAAAVLRFCRIVLRLTDAISREGDD